MCINRHTSFIADFQYMGRAVFVFFSAHLEPQLMVAVCLYIILFLFNQKGQLLGLKKSKELLFYTPRTDSNRTANMILDWTEHHGPMSCSASDECGTMNILKEYGQLICLCIRLCAISLLIIKITIPKQNWWRSNTCLCVTVLLPHLALTVF